jgi:hypothetical protein
MTSAELPDRTELVDPTLGGGLVESALSGGLIEDAPGGLI